jgi:putative toxin-antitoxin system antitoxin component (TIGR02293 family)
MGNELKESVRKDKERAEYRKLRDLARKGGHVYVYFLGLHSYDTQALLKRINEGLSYAAFEELQRHFELPAQELAKVAQMSTRTLNRRKKDGRLEPDESDRLVRLARIFAMALELFEGDDVAARDWLGREQMGLGGSVPFDLMASEVGSREVEALIARLEHGVFA